MSESIMEGWGLGELGHREVSLTVSLFIYLMALRLRSCSVWDPQLLEMYGISVP